jgi:hypothetical protein
MDIVITSVMQYVFKEWTELEKQLRERVEDKLIRGRDPVG